MKLTIERAALLKALSHVQSVVERRTTIPILSNVLLRAEAGPAGAERDRHGRRDRRAGRRARRARRPDDRAGPHALRHRPQIARRRPDRARDAAAGATRWCCAPGRSTFTLACLPPEDYPVMSAGELPHHFALSAGELRTLIDRTRFAISTEETRYYLNGIYLHATKSNEVPVVRAVATDGHRLARFEMTAPEGAAGMPGIIVPRKTVLELRKLVDEGDEEVQIALGETKIRCRDRRGRADLEADRRHLPRLRPRDPGRQRQDPRSRRARASPRRSTASRRSRPSAAAPSSWRSSAAVSSVSATSPENGSAVEELEVRYQQHAARDRVQLALPARHHRPDRRRVRAAPDGRCRLADDPVRRRPGGQWRQRALRADADAGVTAGIRPDPRIGAELLEIRAFRTI